MGGIKFLQFLEVIEDFGQLPLVEDDIFLAQLQARQVSDGADVFRAEGGV